MMMHVDEMPYLPTGGSLQGWHLRDSQNNNVNGI